ncbi:MAG: DUF2917 domain-containing protein [Burkholderiaceae bacterium]
MKPDSRSQWTLTKGAVLHFEVPPGSVLFCTKGSLWITQDSDPRDVVLAPWDSFQPDRGGSVIVSALEASALRLEEASVSCAGSPHHEEAERDWARVHGEALEV